MAGKACTIGSFDLSLIGAVTLWTTVLGGSLGRAISNTLSSPRLSCLIFVGLITFFSNVSRAFAARPLCNCFNVFSSMILLSSSSFCCCLLGSSSLRSASSSLDDLRLTLGVTVTCCVLLLLDIERDLSLSLLDFFF